MSWDDVLVSQASMRKRRDNLSYSEFSIKTIQWDWNKFFAASIYVGTARKENLDQLHVDI